MRTGMVLFVIIFCLSFFGVLIGATIGTLSLCFGVPFPMSVLVIVLVCLLASLMLHLCCLVYISRYDILTKNEKYEEALNKLENATMRFKKGYLDLKIWERILNNNNLINENENNHGE